VNGQGRQWTSGSKKPLKAPSGKRFEALPPNWRFDTAVRKNVKCRAFSGG